MIKRLRDWTVDRFALKPIYDKTLDRRVPKAPWYFGDGATLMLLLGVLVATGMMMTLTYSPHPEAAYESVKYITEVQVMGWFIRALHYWAAGMMVVMTFFHLFRQLLLGGYKPPREATWLFGVFLFFAILVMSFTGYVLRWDERGIHAIRVPLEMFQQIPWIGEKVAIFVQGGTETGAITLTRIYAVHILFLPAAIAAAVGFHLYLVIVHGITSKRERREPVYTAEQQKEIYHAEAESKTEGETFFPETAVHSGTMAMIVFAIVVALALIFGPAELYPEANLVDTTMPAEEWWWWWYSGLTALLPSWFAPYFHVGFPLLLIIVLVLLPFIDRGANRGMRKRPIFLVAVVVIVIAMIVLSAIRRKSEFTGWPMSELPPVPAGVVLSPTAEQGRQLFSQFGCNSCHPIAGHGRKVAVDLANIRDRVSRDEMRAYILRPPPGVAMPPYEGRLSEEQMQHLLDFVHAAQMFPLRQ